MKVRTVIKCVKRLTDDEYSQCHKLNFGHNGNMREDLAVCKREGLPSKAILMKKGDEIIAWALVQFDFEADGANVYFWVIEKYRGKGLGSMLMAQAKRLDENPYVFPHDKTSAAFFKKHIDNIRCSETDKFWLTTPV